MNFSDAKNFNRRDFTQFVNSSLVATRSVSAESYDRLFTASALVLDEDGFGGTDNEDGSVTCTLTDEAWAFALRLAS